MRAPMGLPDAANIFARVEANYYDKHRINLHHHPVRWCWGPIAISPTDGDNEENLQTNVANLKQFAQRVTNTNRGLFKCSPIRVSIDIFDKKRSTDGEQLM